MHQQVANRHLARDPRVVHLKPGQVIDDLVVPADLALIDEDGEVGDRERLAGRAGRENRVRINRVRCSKFSHAVTFGERDLAILDNGDRHSRSTDLLAQCFRPSIEIRWRSGNGNRADRKGDG